ncbi:hypothetical protein N480_19125 [Pseudoalteromonas luteoviolacea S2607]|uniref:ABC transporter permease n=1 Tax=Pseudoalteromonas luteoviolacea TaxID=43657 RepID=UPI0007B06C3C|nr:ABC transporter permease [Pseudoalteromonas luteoviolacea]KZN35299.1 hypothetical protein N480_19125 [Pseudoalteromonas luteoviolacea S2607]
MFYNYLIIALRRLKSDKLFTSVNLLGLGVGLLCFLMTLLYILDEVSYDAFWKQGENIYRVETTVRRNGGADSIQYSRSFAPLTPLAEVNMQGSVAIARLQPMQFLAAYNVTRFYQDVSFVDPSFFDVFDLKFIQGSRENALNTPYKVVLTESTAKKYFGRESALDKVITLDGKHKLQVTGVVQDAPDNTHLNLGMLASIDSLPRMYNERILRNWNFPTTFTYVALGQGQNPEPWHVQLTELANKNVPERIQGTIELGLMPVSEIHLRDNELGGFNTIHVLGVVSALVLLMACINTINLATAKGAERDRETGIRKALGGTRVQLFNQFMVESYLLVIGATILALFFSDLLLPWFNQITGKSLSFTVFFEAQFLIGLLLLVLIAGFMAGAYPAAVMSSYKPVDIFKGSMGYGQGSFSMRMLLLLFQFIVAISITIGTYFIYQQMNHIKNMDLGFSDENVVVLKNIGWTDIKPNYSVLQKELVKHPNIEHVAGSITVPGREFDRVGAFHVEGTPSENGISLNRMATDFGFFQTYDVNLVTGRMFSREYGSDEVGSNQSTSGKATYSAILNETAVRKFGWNDAEDALGKRLISSDKKWGFDIRVVGVVEDFHILTGHSAINPYVFIISTGAVNYASVKINGGELPDVLNYIDNTWNQIIPQYPIVRSFLDDDIDRAFIQWERNGQLMAALSLIAIGIAAVGSFGMAAFSTKNRNKEISMRKVVGASSFDLIRLLVWDLSKPLILANVLAWPLVYIVIRDWLNNFAYRIDISLPVFFLVGVGSLLFCWLTVSYHTLKVARTSPAMTFKHL